RARRGRGRALRASAGRGRAFGAGPPPGPDRPGRGGDGGGAVPQGPDVHHRAYGAQQAGPLPGARAAAAGHLRRRAGHGRRSPPPDRRPGGGDGSGPPPHPHPGRLRVSGRQPAREVDAPGGLADLVVGRAAYDDPETRVLVEAMMADIDERYAADGPGDGDAPDVARRWAVRVEQVTPPLGVFLVARLEGEAVGCGGVRRVPGAAADV